MTTILVPVDFSNVSEKTCATAISLARGRSIELVFLHVMNCHSPLRVFTTDENGGRFPPCCDQTLAAEQLQQWVRQARAQRVTASYRVAYGAPIARILEQASLLPADLIVMGSHDYGSTHGSTVGTTTKGVLYASPCPLVIVPSGKSAVPVAPQGGELVEFID